MKIRSAATLGPQLHMHWQLPYALHRIVPVSMTYPPDMQARPGQASGGLWTASPNEYGSNACIDLAARNQLVRPRKTVDLYLWWLLPDPDATIVTVEDASDYEELVERYPWHTGGIDVATLLQAFDGLHITQAAALAARARTPIETEQDIRLGMWVYESTHWRRLAVITCTEIPYESCAYPLYALNKTYFPVALAMGHVPPDATDRAAVLEDIEARYRDVLDAVAPVKRWLAGAA